MGEAKRRGTREERKKAAIERNKKIAKHYGMSMDEINKVRGRLAMRWHMLKKAAREEILNDEQDKSETLDV